MEASVSRDPVLLKADVSGLRTCCATCAASRLGNQSSAKMLTRYPRAWFFLSDHKALNAMLAQPSRVRVPYLSKETGSSATPEAMPTETDRCFRLAKSGKMP